MPADPLIGRKIDDFIIEERLGQGAMAVVYKAFQPSINRYVALKVIRLDEGQGQQDEFRKRFAREAEVIAKLEHIHILPIYAYGINEEMAYLAMRWLKGGSLSELLRREGVTLDQAGDIFKQIAQGLSYAHSKGVIHRDLKPSNIMLDDTGNAYLTDFGLAKLTEGSGEITKSGTIVGTPAYMSPEQLRGEPLDRRSDIYSLGVILYNMVAGRLPFDTTTSDLVSIIYQHLEKPPTPPSEFNPDIPPEVEAVIMRALQKNRDDRFDEAVDMARAFLLALGKSPGSSDSMSIQRSIRFQSRQGASATKVPGRFTPQRLLIGGAALVAVLVIVGLLVLFSATTNSNTALMQTQQALETISAAATSAALAPTTAPSSVLDDERSSSENILPIPAELDAARARLGPSGFIAYITCNQDSEFHAGLARELRDLAATDQVSVSIYDSENDPYRQVTMIERARADGAGALIVCPLNANLLAPTLTSAQQAGLPIVLFADRMPNYGGVLVGGDNYRLGLEPGRLAGQIIRDELGGRARVIVLDFPSREDIVSRANGLEDGVKEIAPQATIVGRYLGATRDNGRASVEQLLADNVEFNVIVSINDAGAFGAIEALDAADIDPASVIITSIDAEALAQQYISEGHYMRGSVQSNRIGSAEALLNSAIKLLASSRIAEFILVPPGPMITRDSLATPTS